MNPEETDTQEISPNGGEVTTGVGDEGSAPISTEEVVGAPEVANTQVDVVEAPAI